MERWTPSGQEGANSPKGYKWPKGRQTTRRSPDSYRPLNNRLAASGVGVGGGGGGEGGGGGRAFTMSFTSYMRP